MRWPLPWPKSWHEPKAPEGEAEEGEEAEEEEEKPKSLREQAILFGRDLLIAFLVVVLVMGALFAYTRVWPPMVVVESDSMQHSNTDSSIGVIDTGDLVLVQQIGSASDVTTYVQGAAENYETYSNFGDVIIFNAPGAGPDATPIIHRAMVYIVPDATGGFGVPSLVGRTDWSGTTAGGAASTPANLVSLTLHNVQSWPKEFGGTFHPQDVTWDLSRFPRADGFLTKGDHNGYGDTWGGAVTVPRILGKARGELPWFGLIKLTVSPSPTGCCHHGWGDPAAPKNSWDSLLVSLILIIVGPFAADFGWSYYKDRKKAKRKAAKAAAGNPGKADSTPPKDAPPAEEGVAEEAGPTSAPPKPEDEPTDEAQTTSAGPEDGDREGP